MNDNNNSNNGNVRPYKASGNLNTIIGNPSVNINDTMDVNIQNMVTNKIPVNNNNINTSLVENNIQNQINNTAIPNTNVKNNEKINNTNNNYNATDQDNNYVTKTYVGVNFNHKKKNNQLKIGPEFKIALLIIVILMIFIFLLPKISEIFRGY